MKKVNEHTGNNEAPTSLLRLGDRKGRPYGSRIHHYSLFVIHLTTHQPNNF